MTKLHRMLDWPSHLQAFAQSQIGQPFIWGKTDCASLARYALIEMFGPELALYLPLWDSARSAAEKLEQYGSVKSVLEDSLLAEPTTVPFMRTGDIVISPEPEEEIGRESVMVCIEGRKCLASTREGVAFSDVPPDALVYSLWEVTIDG